MEDTNGGTPAASAQDVPPANTNANASSNGSETKVSLSLGTKKKKKKTSTNTSTAEHFAASTDALAAEQADDNGTVADRAHEVAQNRQEALVIPCVGSGGAGGERNRPLLAGRAQTLKTEDSTNDAAVKKEEDTEQTAIKSEPDAVIKSENTDDDAAAAEALIRSATDRTPNTSSGNVGDTNFDARGNLIIKKEENTNELLAQAMRGGNIEDDETQEFQRDLARQADDVDVESDAYAAVPIAEFGAAMLRGMGWTGTDDNGKRKVANDGKKGGGDEEDAGGMMRPRHHRLGLGAAPRPVAVSANGNSKPGGRHRALRPHEIERAERERKDEEEFRRQAAELERLDRQRTVQDGSVVRVRRSQASGGNNEAVVSKRRAILVKTSGVPGLNQVLVRWEGGAMGEEESVRKSDVVLVEQKELDENPFQEETVPSNSKANGKKSLAASEEEKKESSGGDLGRDRDRERKRDRYDDERGRDRNRDRYDDSRRDRKKSRSSRDDDWDRRRRRDRDDEYYESSRDRKRSKKEMSDRADRRERGSDDPRNNSSPSNRPSESLHWLTPNIRVRMISKKPAKGRQYKEKGVVMDVLPGGAHATVQMTDGEVLDKVPERYLETALPKVGGNSIVLVGDAQHRHAKGRLLERDSSKGQAAIQLFEDMNILTLSLDDFAEWCGPLDSDMMS